MKFLLPFFLLLSSLVAGEILFRSNAFISKKEAVGSEIQTETSVQQETITQRPKRVLRKIERVIEPENTELIERGQEIVTPENAETIYYINREGELYFHPNSLLDLRKLANIPQSTPLYYGFEGKIDDSYNHPFPVPVDEAQVFYSDSFGDESPRSLSYKVDSVPPELESLSFHGKRMIIEDVTYYGLGVELKVGAVDRESGIKAIRILDQDEKIIHSAKALFEQEKSLFDTFVLDRPDIKGIIVEIEDNVTNITRSELIPIHYDSTPPQVVVQVDPIQNASELENNICKVGTRIGVIATDDTGVSEIQYRYPKTDWIPYTSRLILSKPGIYKIEFRAIDVFGNESMPEFIECRVFE